MGIFSQIRAEFAAGSGLSHLGRRDYLGLNGSFAVIEEKILGPRGVIISKLSELPLDAIDSALRKASGRVYPWTDHNNEQLQLARRDLCMN